MYAGAVLAALVACGGQGTLPEEIEDPESGAISGELAIYIADFADGRTEKRYVLRSATGDQKLVFHAPPNALPGARLHVWGRQSGDVIDVASYRLARSDPGSIGSQSSALVDQPKAAPRVECPVLVRINGGAAPASITLDMIEQQFHTGPKSVNAFYTENSYGKDSVIGKTYGPFDYAMNNCDVDALATALAPKIPAADGCKQFGWVLVPEQRGCDWSGLAEGGSPKKPAKNTWFNASIGCVVSVQEPGHNYGLDHSSTLTCRNGWFSDDLASCTHNEYGDRFDPMGSGCRHMNVWQKQYQQWFGKCNAIKVTSSGTFNLLPMERACDGVQSIQLPFPGGKVRTLHRPSGGGDDPGNDPISSYYLEYRTSAGVFDTGMTPQVLVHVGLEPPPPTGATEFGPHVWLLDASATATAGKIGSQPGMVAGGTFSDPAGGLKVTVTSIDGEKAVIQVEYTQGTAAPTCIDSTSVMPPGPESCTGTVVGSDAGVSPPADSGGAAGSAGAGPARDAGRDAGGLSDSASPTGTGGQAGSSGTSDAAGGGAGGPAPPSGSGGSSAVATGTAGAAGIGQGGAATVHAQVSDIEGGCSCRVGARTTADQRAPLWMLLCMGALIRRRRQRGGRPRSRRSESAAAIDLEAAFR